MAQNPEKRLRELQAANPCQLILYAHAPGTRTLERFIHRVLRRHRLSGEWFAGTQRTLVVASLLASAQEQCEDIVDCHWQEPYGAVVMAGCPDHD